MNTTNTGFSRARQTIRNLLKSARARWKITAAVAGAVLAALAFMLPGEKPAPAPERTESSHAADSVVVLDSTARRLAGIEVLAATAQGPSSLTANGTITYDANRVSMISSRVDARVVTVRADLGQAVSAGSVLAILASAEVGRTRGDLERAQANLDIARRNLERERRLFAQQITPQKELLEAEGLYRSALADVQSARASLSAVGAAGGNGGTFSLSTPINGVVVERNASPGQSVGPSTNLFIVADLRELWITVDVYEKDLPRIREGAAATVLPVALNGESFMGRVTYAGGIVDTASRTFKVRVEVANSNLRLRPGMFAQVRIATVGGGTQGSLSIPETAIQDINGRPAVFLQDGPAGRYVARTVAVGQKNGDGTITVAGIQAGELVVVKGAFQLKSELTKASFAEDE